MGAIREACERVANSGRFQAFIFGVIVFNAIVLGLETYDAVDDRIGGALAAANDACLGVFLVELAIRIAAYGRRPQDFFRDGWNVFDFVVITAALVPGLRQNATLLRLVRLLRIVRIISVLPDVRVLLRGMVRSLPPIGSMAVLVVLLIYLYGMVGWLLFHAEDPGRWGNLGDAMLNLFVMLTLEEWPRYMRAGMEIHPWSWIYFVSYVLVAGFLIINILIGIVINAMEGARREERATARAVRQELLSARPSTRLPSRSARRFARSTRSWPSWCRPSATPWTTWRSDSAEMRLGAGGLDTVIGPSYGRPGGTRDAPGLTHLLGRDGACVPLARRCGHRGRRRSGGLQRRRPRRPGRGRAERGHRQRRVGRRGQRALRGAGGLSATRKPVLAPKQPRCPRGIRGIRELRLCPCRGRLQWRQPRRLGRGRPHRGGWRRQQRRCGQRPVRRGRRALGDRKPGLGPKQSRRPRRRPDTRPLRPCPGCGRPQRRWA